MTDYPRSESVKGRPDTAYRHYAGGHLVSFVSWLVQGWRGGAGVGRAAPAPDPTSDHLIDKCGSPRAQARLFVHRNAVRARVLMFKAITWAESCADAHAAAALYANLSRLSDAELQRRGLARDTLARDLLEDIHVRAGDQ